MRLAIVIPSNNFQVLRPQGEDLIPAVEPQKVRWENPVLAVRDLRAEVGAEPGGHRCNVRLSSKGGYIGGVSCLNGNVCSRSWGFVVAIVWPGLYNTSIHTRHMRI